MAFDTLIPYQYAHFLQLAIKQDFVYQDRSDDENMELYNQIEPPKIPLDKITYRKIVLIQGDMDMSSDREDIDRLKSELKGNYNYNKASTSKKILINTMCYFSCCF